MNEKNDYPVVSGNMPDEFDITLGNALGLPNSQHTKPVTHQIIGLLGVAKTFIVRTARQQDRQLGPDDKEIVAAPQFTVFLESYAKGEQVRIVLPPKVTDLIMRQREALTDKSRKSSARKGAAERKARGFTPNLAGLRKARKRAKR